MWPYRPNMTDICPMAVLSQEIRGIRSQDLRASREITIDQVGFEPEGDAITSAMERFYVVGLGKMYRDAPLV